jgi:hypothetical protein
MNKIYIVNIDISMKSHLTSVSKCGTMEVPDNHSSIWILERRPLHKYKSTDLQCSVKKLMKFQLKCHAPDVEEILVSYP